MKKPAKMTETLVIDPQKLFMSGYLGQTDSIKSYLPPSFIKRIGKRKPYIVSAPCKSSQEIAQSFLADFGGTIILTYLLECSYEELNNKQRAKDIWERIGRPKSCSFGIFIPES